MENTDRFEFNYIYDGREIGKLPFRPGDLVRVKDWGGIYDMYTSAFIHFGFEVGKKPYYCNFSWCDRPKCTTRLFKVIDVAKHSYFSDILVVYIIDNENRGAIITGSYLKPFKVYPLRRGESNEIKIERIKQI